MSQFEKFKVEKYQLKKQKDDICFNSKDMFDQYHNVSLIGLKYMDNEGTN